MKGNLTPAILAGAHTLVWRVMVYTPDGRVVATQVESGSVTLTGRDRGRTRGNLTIVDNANLWDRTGLTGVSPYGGSVKVQADVGSERIDVAGGLVLEVTRSRPGSTIDVDFVDYGAMLDWCQLVSPIGISAGDWTGDWIRNFVNIAAPTEYVYETGSSGTTVPTSYVEQGSHESGLSKLCTDVGMVVWLDEKRRCRIQVEQVYNSTPAVWTFADGQVGTVVSETQSLSRDGVPAAIVVLGETPQGAQVAYTGQAYQQSGPTRWGGPFGYPRERVNRPVLNSQQAANAAARTILDQRRQLKRTIRMSAVTHPGIEPGDRVDALLSGQRMTMVVQSVTFRLSPEPMQLDLVEAMARGAGASGSAVASRDTIHLRDDNLEIPA